MQFIDLEYQQKRIRRQLESGIFTVLDHGKYIMGPEVKELEQKLANFVGVGHAVACASGTDALLMALMAYGVGPGDAVFTSPFTFIATAEVIQLLGATPVFVDIDPKTFNMDPDKLVAAIHAIKTGNDAGHPLPAKNGIKPKAVIGVDLFGLPAQYLTINQIAEDHGLIVIEDAAQSFGAEYNTKKACSLASMGCTSFFPAKPLGCYGDGGMCFTDDAQLAAVLESIRVHGKGSDKYDNVRIGINGRLDTLQAAVLLVKFSIFSEEMEMRHQVARRYERLLSGIASIITPTTPSESRSAWAQYSLLAKNHDQRSIIMNELKKSGVPTAVYYPKPLHLQTAFAQLGYRDGAFPVSEDAAKRIFSLPMHPYLENRDQEEIAAIIGGAAS